MFDAIEHNSKYLFIISDFIILRDISVYETY